jgi:hypothetical protein
MTMPNRMHGKPIPPKDGIVKVCPYCLKNYLKARLVKRGSLIIKYCPNPKCNKILGQEVDLQS